MSSSCCARAGVYIHRVAAAGAAPRRVRRERVAEEEDAVDLAQADHAADLLVASQWTAARLVLHRKAEGVLEDRARRARRDDGEERDDVDVLLDEFFHRRLRVVVRDDGEVAVVRVRVDRRLAVVGGRRGRDRELRRRGGDGRRGRGLELAGARRVVRGGGGPQGRREGGAVAEARGGERGHVRRAQVQAELGDGARELGPVRGALGKGLVEEGRRGDPALVERGLRGRAGVGVARDASDARSIGLNPAPGGAWSATSACSGVGRAAPSSASAAARRSRVDAASARADARRSRAARGERPREKGFQDGMPARGDAMSDASIDDDGVSTRLPKCHFREVSIPKTFDSYAALAVDARGPARGFKGRRRVAAKVTFWPGSSAGFCRSIH